MSGVIYFNLIKYDNILQTLREFDKNLKDKNNNDFFIFLNKIEHLMLDNSKQIQLDEDYLTDWKKEGTIFFLDKPENCKDLEREIIRPLSKRNIGCFQNCLRELENNNYLFAIGEFIDCILDYNRSDKKMYISLNEYYLFQTLIEIIQNKLKKEQ